MGLEKSRQIMIVFKLLGHVDYGRTYKDWMFPGLFVYKHFVLKRGEGDKKVATIKGGISPSTEEYFWDEHMRDSWVIWKSVA